MHGTYNPYLVALSLLVAVLASYTMLDLIARIRQIEATGTKRAVWLLGGAAAMGSGIWSIHLIGTLACRMPVPLDYDPWVTTLSLVLGIALVYFALRCTAQSERTANQLNAGGVLMGMGVVAMHFVGMSAARVHPAVHYRSVLVLVSIAIAMVASWVAVWVQFTLQDEGPRRAFLKRCGYAVALGFAQAAMHYVGLTAIIFPAKMVHGEAGDPTHGYLALLVTVLSLSGLIIALVVSRMDSRFDQLVLLSGLNRDETGAQQTDIARFDLMTGVASRASFIDQAEQKITQAEANGTLVGIFFLNLDGFKTVNDSLGYQAGDELLRAFSEDLLRRVRSGTLVARLGGDEFVILLEDMRETEMLRSIAKSIFDRIQKNFRIDGMPLRATASAGIAIYPQDGDTVAALMKSANIAMYCAKQQGKNLCRFFEPAMRDAANRALHINRSLGEALEKGQFSLVYQPKFDGRRSSIIGAEALIRWNHPVAGNIPPLDFIPIAEETGQIMQISEWVIAQVCRQLKAWERMGLPPLKIAINLSPEQLMQEGCASRIAAMVAEAGVRPSSILFEITETAAMREPKQAGEMIREFQRAGFDFSIDDFGTGYSSMAYLQQFRVKELKIDRFFIHSLEVGGEEEHTIVAAIIALAHALHMTVVAEGVETAYQLRKLKDMDCDEIQGYLLGMPMTPASLETLLREESEAADCAAIALLQHQSSSPAVLHSLMA